MITIYKNKNDIPQTMDYIELNDIFFNQNTVAKLNGQAKKIVKKIDETELISQYKIASKFNGVILDIDRLSTGCKTVLNVFYFPDKVFCLKECGDNALEVLYGLEQGSVYSDYAMIPFQICAVRAYSEGTERVIEDYEDLKRWWENEK